MNLYVTQRLVADGLLAQFLVEVGHGDALKLEEHPDNGGKVLIELIRESWVVGAALGIDYVRGGGLT